MVNNNQISHFSKENGISKWNIGDNLTFSYYDNTDDSIFGKMYNITIGASTKNINDQILQLTINIYQVLEEKITSEFMHDSVAVTFSKETQDGEIIDMYNLNLEPVMFRTIMTLCTTADIGKQTVFTRKTSLKSYLAIISSFVDEIKDIKTNKEMQKALKIMEPYLKESLNSTLFAKKSKKKIKNK